MYSALTVAYFVINWFKNHNLSISKLKLQILLLYIYAEFAAKGINFIKCDFYTNPLGVMIPQIYKRFKGISPDKARLSRYSIRTRDIAQLDFIIKKYAYIPTENLVNAVCNNALWIESVDKNGYGEIFTMDMMIDLIKEI